MVGAGGLAWSTQSFLCGLRLGWMDAFPQTCPYRAVVLVCRGPLGLPGYSGKPRASLHPGDVYRRNRVRGSSAGSEEILAQGRIGHTETGAHVFGEQLD